MTVYLLERIQRSNVQWVKKSNNETNKTKNKNLQKKQRTKKQNIFHHKTP